MENSDQCSQNRCFREWMNLQEQDLSELLHALDNLTSDTNGPQDLNQLVERNIQHEEEYVNRRSTLARRDIFPYFSPTWCTSLEGSMSWAGDYRPSTFIRLVYALCGNDIASHLDEYLQGSGTRGDMGLGELSATQIQSINDLQLKTIRKEDKITKKLAGLQEEIADQPIAIIAKELRMHDMASREADVALNALASSLMSVFEAADNLRLNTLKELIGLLNPIQAVDYLAASRKLRLCVHAWGRRRDCERGRN